MSLQRVRVIDSHTGGEPTRVVISGLPGLGEGPLSDRAKRFREHHDRFRSAVVNEPRGNDAMVGALLVEPHQKDCAAGVIFFNNVGLLNMCGHGTIGLVATLAYLDRLAPGPQRIDTPVGVVSVEYHGNGEATIGNVPSYRLAARVPVEVPGHGAVHGDIAWGGNWFYLVGDCPIPLTLSNLEPLTDFTWRIRQALHQRGITGANGMEIDHIELFGPPGDPANHSRNFVLCPGKAYDRSPCGTGTSAKLACLAADGKLKPGDEWRQESIVGSVFRGRYEQNGEMIQPFVRGSAFVNADAELIFDDNDPFCWGIRH